MEEEEYWKKISKIPSILALSISSYGCEARPPLPINQLSWVHDIN